MVSMAVAVTWRGGTGAHRAVGGCEKVGGRVLRGRVLFLRLPCTGSARPSRRGPAGCTMMN